MGYWEEWGQRLFDANADYSMFDGVRIYCDLSRTDDESHMNDVMDHVDRAKEKGLFVMLCLDSHLQLPYHGRPPHLGPNDKIIHTEAGYGLLPFGWVEGWVEARNRVTSMLNLLNPELVQWQEDFHIRSGWDFSTKPEYHYNDSFTVFQQGAYEADWHGTVVIPDSPGYAIQQRGLRRARDSRPFDESRPDDLMWGFMAFRESDYTWAEVPDRDDVPDDPDPDPDYDHPTYDLIEEAEGYLDLYMEERPPTVRTLRKAIKRLRRARRILKGQ